MDKIEDISTIEEFFTRDQEYREKYGPKTITLFQVGTFFEVYGYKNDNETEMQGSLIDEFCEICDMEKGKKHGYYKNKSLYMAGFKTTPWQLQKYKNRLVDHNYTVVVIVQLEEMQENTSGVKKRKRIVEGVYSPGTHVPVETDSQLNNNMFCIWIEPYKVNGYTNHAIGIAIINVVTNESYLLEHEIKDSNFQATSFDDLERCLNIYCPKEVIFVGNIPNIKTYVPSLQDVYIHYYTQDMEIIKNAEKQVYCKHVISKYFEPDAINQCAEFSEYTLATQSFCVLMHFLEERNPHLCKHIKLPKMRNESKTMILANHTLYQLDILTVSGRSNNVLSSIYNFTNKCKTKMGSREFHQLLTHPTYDQEWLTNEYETMNNWLENHKSMIATTRTILNGTHDIPKLCKQLIFRKLAPSELFKIYKTVKCAEQLWVCMADMKWMHKYLDMEYTAVHNKMTTFLSYIERNLIIDNCVTLTQFQHFDFPIFNPNVFQEIDDLIENNKRNELQLKTIQKFLECQVNPTGKGEFVKIITDKSSVSLQMTKLRSDNLKNKMNTSSYKNSDIILDNNVTFQWKDVSFINSTKNNVELRFPLCNKICKAMNDFRSELNEAMNRIYLSMLEEIETEYLETIDMCGQFLSKIDVLLMKCHLAQEYQLCCPVIDRNTEKSYIDATGLRHLLIEQLNTNEIYVTNDVNIGRGEIDILNIFGTNAVGKTSYMRSVGIAVIMAQSGMYVPCSSFTYVPYKSLYSRILSQDNLFKGLSTFTVEMSELRVILEYADEYSLVLGDELCSGTETTSALSIVMGALQILHEKRASCVLATHFHEIVEWPELTDMSRIRCCHMSMTYDDENDCLIYERKLKDGPGICNYGLEVCKSLYMNKSFLEKAYVIRRTHFPEFEGSLTLKKSRYNSKKIRDLCEICNKEMGTEIHHLQEQHNAKENGYIDGFHKNHPSNLSSVCEKCHLKLHHNDMSPLTTESSVPDVKKVVRKKTTKGKYFLGKK